MNPGRSLSARGALPAPRRSAQTFIVALGVLAFAAAHRLAYLLGEAAQHSHDAPARHGYLPVVEFSAAAIAVVALALFAAAVWRSGASTEDLVPFRRPMHLLGICGVGPASIFVLVEFCERSFAAPPGLVLLIGVGLQLALGCAVLLGSCRVLRVVAAVACGTQASFVCRRMAAGRGRVPGWGRPRGVLIGRANPSRAPPGS